MRIITWKIRRTLMISYSREEIFSATLAAKKFGEILRKLGKRQLSKVAISKNNAIEAVILPVSEYELLVEETMFRKSETVNVADRVADTGVKRRKSNFGSAAGLIEMTDDFDAPLEDFKEYL
jgi:PHD/YefM family antitoxin component YafN of YafNO toxin-antitoxin module